MKGLANEVAKNLVLAGVGSLTIVDDDPVTEEDLGSQFLLRQEHVGMDVSVLQTHHTSELTSNREPKQLYHNYRN
jgi:molybdopterin/thiamine biosynthesis adenylyltransferase